MKKNQDRSAGALSPEPCVLAELGDLLPDYIVGLLSRGAAEAVREHLQLCRRCAEDYRDIMGLRAAAQKLFAAAAREHAPECEGGGTNVRHFSDYKK